MSGPCRGGLVHDNWLIYFAERTLCTSIFSSSMELFVTIVDDDEDVRDAVALLMRLYDWKVSEYDSSSAFLTDLMDGHHPDCVVIDLHMPEMNGVEIMEELSCKKFEIPIIILSVLPDDPLLNDAYELGAVVLQKPNIADELIETIHDILQRKAN